MIFSGRYSDIQNLFLTLPCIGSPAFHQAEAVIKRESGASPEQSRCCEFHKTLPAHYPMPLELLREGRLQQKRVRRPAMPIIYHCFRGKSGESNEPGLPRPSFYSSTLDSKKVKH